MMPGATEGILTAGLTWRSARNRPATPDASGEPTRFDQPTSGQMRQASRAASGLFHRAYEASGGRGAAGIGLTKRLKPRTGSRAHPSDQRTPAAPNDVDASRVAKLWCRSEQVDRRHTGIEIACPARHTYLWSRILQFSAPKRHPPTPADMGAIVDDISPFTGWSQDRVHVNPPGAAHRPRRGRAQRPHLTLTLHQTDDRCRLAGPQAIRAISRSPACRRQFLVARPSSRWSLRLREVAQRHMSPASLGLDFAHRPRQILRLGLQAAAKRPSPSVPNPRWA